MISETLFQMGETKACLKVGGQEPEDKEARRA